MKSRDPDGVSDLRDWLRRNKFEQYADAFEANDIDLDILPELSERDLEQLGVSLGNRRRLLKALAERAAEPAKSKPSDAEASGEAEAQLPRPSYQGPATKVQLPRPSYQGPATKAQVLCLVGLAAGSSFYRTSRSGDEHGALSIGADLGFCSVPGGKRRKRAPPPTYCCASGRPASWSKHELIAAAITRE